MSEIIKRKNSQIIGMNLTELEDLSEEFSQSRFRGKQLFNSVYKQRTDSFNNINTLFIYLNGCLSTCSLSHPNWDAQVTYTL